MLSEFWPIPVQSSPFPDAAIKSIFEFLIVWYNLRLFSVVPKLKLQIDAPFFSAYWIAWMIAFVVPAPSFPPRAFNTITFIFVFPAIPAIPRSLIDAEMVPAPCVPWLSSSPKNTLLLLS